MVAEHGERCDAHALVPEEASDGQYLVARSNAAGDAETVRYAFADLEAYATEDVLRRLRNADAVGSNSRGR
jgi:hypothetical protein